MQEPRWVIVLLLFSPLVLMPMGQRLGSPLWHSRRRSAELLAAVLLVPCFLLRPGILATLLSLPWLALRVWAALETLLGWRTPEFRRVDGIMFACAKVFPAIGAAWLTAHRAGWQILGFDALVVLLTAAHFHHAGFTLPLVAALNARSRPNWLAGGSCLCILAGVPLVAAGITFTHLQVWQRVEPFAVAVLVAGSLGVAAMQGVTGISSRSMPPLLRILFIVSGLSLAVAMGLALSYGLRTLFPALALPMPSMWALHGTLNVFGFGLCGIGAWRIWLARQAGPEAP